MNTIRICVCGDEGVGKSSLISCFVKNHFVTGRIQAVLPQINLPPSLGGDNVSTSIIDTSPSPTERTSLNREIQKSSVILLVYSDNYSYERVGLFWMPHFRSLGVNVPVVLCANKSDLSGSNAASQVIEDEMLPLMNEFKELDACIRTSARERTNINEVFYLCQKAVTHPIAPLFDSKELALKPAAVTALQRIFYLSDSDQDGYLNDREMLAFQQKCFGKTLSDDELHNIKQSLLQHDESAASEKGVTSSGFLLLNRLFAEKGRHETIWIILRTFHYTDSLSLKDSFLYPKFDVLPFASAELSPAGYQFLFDLFLLFDKDNDGGLNSSELAALFVPTPGLPISWSDAGFPATTLRNESGHVTLQGWLAQWSMTTFTEPRTTLAYLAYFGFESPLPNSAGTVAALKVTKPRKRRRRPPRVDRNVLHAYIVGAPGAGKSALLDAFLALPFTPDYHPGIKPRVAVNSVELPGGKQVYLILEELGELEHAILSHPSKLDTSDLLVYTYDSSDSDSFAHIASVFEKHEGLNSALLPSIFVGLKADLDKAMQRTERQPDVFAEEKGLTKPRYTSARWESVSEVFVQIAEAALNPAGVIPRVKGEESTEDRSALYIGGAVGVVVLAAGWMIWRRVGRGE